MNFETTDVVLIQDTLTADRGRRSFAPSLDAKFEHFFLGRSAVNILEIIIFLKAFELANHLELISFLKAFSCQHSRTNHFLKAFSCHHSRTNHFSQGI